MKDYINIGSSPVSEDCAQVGTRNYYERAKEECGRFLDLIRSVCGPEPEGSTAELRIKSFPHDFGSYLEVVCFFDDEDELGIDYAYFVESNSPEYWDDKPGSSMFMKSFTQTQVKEILKKVYNQDEEAAEDMINICLTDLYGNYSAPRFTSEEQVKKYVDKRLEEV